LTLAQRGKHAEAIAEYKAALASDPKAVLVYYNLGNSYLNTGRPKEAVAAYDEAIRLAPAFATAHNNRGQALEAIGNWDEAVAAYREAVKHQPAWAVPQSNLTAATMRKQRAEREARIAPFPRLLIPPAK
jgi:tetratricopeptide (TPR) repeat protein